MCVHNKLWTQKMLNHFWIKSFNLELIECFDRGILVLNEYEIQFVPFCTFVLVYQKSKEWL